MLLNKHLSEKNIGFFFCNFMLKRKKNNSCQVRVILKFLKKINFNLSIGFQENITEFLNKSKVLKNLLKIKSFFDKHSNHIKLYRFKINKFYKILIKNANIKYSKLSIKNNNSNYMINPLIRNLRFFRDTEIVFRYQDQLLNTLTCDPKGTETADDAISLNFSKNLSTIEYGMHFPDFSNLFENINLFFLKLSEIKRKSYYQKKNYDLLPFFFSQKLFSLCPLVDRSTISITTNIEPVSFINIINLKRSVIKNKRYINFFHLKKFFDLIMKYLNFHDKKCYFEDILYFYKIIAFSFKSKRIKLKNFYQNLLEKKINDKYDKKLNSFYSFFNPDNEYYFYMSNILYDKISFIFPNLSNFFLSDVYKVKKLVYRYPIEFFNYYNYLYLKSKYFTTQPILMLYKNKSNLFKTQISLKYGSTNIFMNIKSPLRKFNHIINQIKIVRVL
ncbi:hypothetical protein (nucleomorph) [Guillardia theta]|uniref:RNB domain-containing protein n=1 Tax=Guillardia theta TaxID=55529 RepID=Q98RN4_GUITH|nr:hypothetical protein GTHECHR1120 [Guillardia theta]AAK39913.1 hypothetical protein [Guillardia theta]|mmetsp:Transcript_2604/g.8698  ORF Transcript_2604/g.8698 Transcript_2604/m.8698 type:complete len:444 (+) Transcript_2604:1279-2610(+)